MKATTPRTCRGCQAKPVATTGSEYCYDCRPGGPYVPPPCRRCGTRENYYSARLCWWCHPGRPAVPNSCPDCLAWGVYVHSRGVCLACRMYRKRHRDRGACRICRHTAALWDGACRLCRRQAALAEKQRGGKNRMDLEGDNRHGQQLYFGDMDRRVRLSVPLASRQRHRTAWGVRSAPGRPIQPVAHRQLLLFDAVRDLRAGHRRGFPVPGDAVLAAVLDDHAADYGQRHGWTYQLKWKVRRAVRILVATQDTPGGAILASAVAQLDQMHLPAGHVRAILAEAGFLEDDRLSSLEVWFTTEIADLPPAIEGELRLWFTTLNRGHRTPPRSKPLSPRAVRHYASHILPLARVWATSYDSLRAVTHADVVDALPSVASRRRDAVTAARSLFRVLKRHRVIFRNPTVRVTHPNILSVPQPVEPQVIRTTLDDEDPVRAVLGALVAFHALTVADLRHLLLTDITDGRLHLSGRTIVLAAPVRVRLAAYLDLRAERWPTTVNPHLFINRLTATHTGVTSNVWATRILGVSAQALREDRILDELLAIGDLRRLCDLFGLSIGGAERYRAALDAPGHPTDQG